MGVIQTSWCLGDAAEPSDPCEDRIAREVRPSIRFCEAPELVLDAHPHGRIPRPGSLLKQGVQLSFGE